MNRFPRRRALMVIGAALIAASCETTTQPPAFPQISYAHLPAISLDVARIEVENRYRPPATAPNVEHRFPVSLAATTLNWGQDRLRPVGAGGVARVVLRRASVVEVPLKRTKGVRGVFTTDQSERYDAVLDVMVEVLDATGSRRATVESTARRSRSVPENLSVNQRDTVWFEMTEALMADLNRSLEAQIRTHMKDWLR